MTIVRHDRPYLRDRIAMLVLRGMIAFQGEMLLGPKGRPDYDKMIAPTPGAAGVSYEADIVEGIPGWWCRPNDSIGTGVILYLHGGGYALGSAKAYRNYVGQTVARVGIPAFVADYSLAPEHPFPAAVNDALAAYRGLANLGYAHIVLAGDSAGADLSLALMAKVSRDTSLPRPAGAMVASPVTDFALTGRSIEERAKADPLLTKKVMLDIAAVYLGDHDPRLPDASPLYGDMSELPPTLIHVGEDEILLDDSMRYAERLEAAGGDVVVHVWKGMPHVFCTLVGLLKASAEALDIGAAFIRQLPCSSPVRLANREGNSM
jgi:monoterpene epsilon-lactone hydrolase